MSEDSQDMTEREEQIQKRREAVEQRASELDATWNGECTRCGSSDEWGVSLYDDYNGLKRHTTMDVDLCADCRDAFEDWLDEDDQ